MGIPGTGNDDHAHKGGCNFRQLAAGVRPVLQQRGSVSKPPWGCEVGRSLEKSAPLANARPRPHYPFQSDRISSGGHSAAV